MTYGKLLAILFTGAALALAQTADVEKAMRDSEAAWNRGDLESFASYYDDSPQTTFAFANDTSGALAALGINTFFSGAGSRDIGISQTIKSDPASDWTGVCQSKLTSAAEKASKYNAGVSG